MRSSYSTPAAFSSATSSPARLVGLRGEHDVGIVEHSLHDGHDVERVVGRRGIEEVERGQRERGQRLVEREVALEVDGDAHEATALVRRLETLHDLRGQQRPVDVDGPPDVVPLRGTRLVVVEQQAPQGRAAVARVGRAR